MIYDDDILTLGEAYKKVSKKSIGQSLFGRRYDYLTETTAGYGIEKKVKKLLESDTMKAARPYLHKLLEKESVTKKDVNTVNKLYSLMLDEAVGPTPPKSAAEAFLKLGSRKQSKKDPMHEALVKKSNENEKRLNESSEYDYVKGYLIKEAEYFDDEDEVELDVEEDEDSVESPEDEVSEEFDDEEVDVSVDEEDEEEEEEEVEVEVDEDDSEEGSEEETNTTDDRVKVKLLSFYKTDGAPISDILKGIKSFGDWVMNHGTNEERRVMKSFLAILDDEYIPKFEEITGHETDVPGGNAGTEPEDDEKEAPSDEELPDEDEEEPSDDEEEEEVEVEVDDEEDEEEEKEDDEE